MRNMSFSMTPDQIRNKTKTVTRRFGWADLKPGDRLRPVFKCQGLRRDQKVERLLPDNECIEVVKAGEEPLAVMSQSDCVKEGFPEMTPLDFLQFLMAKYTELTPFSDMNRIEFIYVEV